MLRGLDAAAAGMIAMQRRHSTISNNLANINTPGFKAEEAVLRTFPEWMIYQLGGMPEAPSLNQAKKGNLAYGVVVQENVPIFKQGALVETQQPLHLAIWDNRLPDPETGIVAAAFFAVQLPDVTVGYTRAGQWMQDQQGTWVTPQGYPLLDVEGNPVQTQGAFKVQENGQILLQTLDGGQEAGQELALVMVANPNQLLMEGGGIARWDATLDEEPPALDSGQGQVQVKQGYLERANVEPIQSMTDLLAAQRLYEANQKVIQAYDRTLDKAANELARI